MELDMTPINHPTYIGYTTISHCAYAHGKRKQKTRFSHIRPYVNHGVLIGHRLNASFRAYMVTYNQTPTPIQTRFCTTGVASYESARDIRERNPRNGRPFIEQKFYTTEIGIDLRTQTMPYVNMSLQFSRALYLEARYLIYRT